MDSGSDLIAGIVVVSLAVFLAVYYRAMGKDEKKRQAPLVQVAATTEMPPSPSPDIQLLRSIDGHLARVSRFITLLYWSAAISLVIAVVQWLVRV
jgi:hypothetical protein